MPPLPSVPGVIKFVLSGTYDDAEWAYIFYFGYTGSAPSIGNLNSLCLNVGDSWNSEMASVESEHLTVTLATAIDLSSDTGASGEQTFDAVGSLSGASLPASAAMVIQKIIARRYRGGHPRNYILVGDTTKLAASSAKMWAASFVTAVATAYGDWTLTIPQTVGSTTITGMVNVSYYSGKERRVTPVVDVITEWEAKDRLCSQRRRLGKVGG